MHAGGHGECVLIDPVQSPWMFGSFDYILANGAVDLATFHMSLLLSYPVMDLLKLDLQQKLLIDEALLDSYLQYFDARNLRDDVLALSRATATRVAGAYPERINFLIAKIKVRLSNRIIAKADKVLGW